MQKISLGVWLAVVVPYGLLNGFMVVYLTPSIRSALLTAFILSASTAIACLVLMIARNM